jgi:hypothetical protein
MYGQNSFLSSLSGGQRQGTFGNLDSKLSDEEKRFLEELIRKEVEKQKQQGGLSSFGGRGMY